MPRHRRRPRSRPLHARDEPPRAAWDFRAARIFPAPVWPIAPAESPLALCPTTPVGHLEHGRPGSGPARPDTSLVRPAWRPDRPRVQPRSSGRRHSGRTSASGTAAGTLEVLHLAVGGDPRGPLIVGFFIAPAPLVRTARAASAPRCDSERRRPPSLGHPPPIRPACPTAVVGPPPYAAPRSGPHRPRQRPATSPRRHVPRAVSDSGLKPPAAVPELAARFRRPRPRACWARREVHAAREREPRELTAHAAPSPREPLGPDARPPRRRPWRQARRRSPRRSSIPTAIAVSRPTRRRQQWGASREIKSSSACTPGPRREPWSPPDRPFDRLARRLPVIGGSRPQLAPEAHWRHHHWL